MGCLYTPRYNTFLDCASRRRPVYPKVINTFLHNASRRTRRARHASCESPWHFSAKHHFLAACFPLMVPFRTRFSPYEMARTAYVQRLIRCLYTLRYCYIPTCRFTAQMVVSPDTQTCINAVFICINNCTRSNGLFDKRLDGLLLHIGQHVDDDLTSPLHHPKDGRFLLL